MKLSYFIGIISLSCMAAFLSGFFYGRYFEKQKILQTTLIALENRKQIEDEISQFSPYDLCLALGGLSDDCAALLRGLDKTTSP